MSLLWDLGWPPSKHKPPDVAEQLRCRNRSRTRCCRCSPITGPAYGGLASHLRVSPSRDSAADVNLIVARLVATTASVVNVTTKLQWSTSSQPGFSRRPWTTYAQLFVQLLSFLLPISLCVSCAQGVDLHIAGFFPTTYNLSEGAIGRGVVPAVNLALEHLNNATQFLPGYTLAIQWNDTQVRSLIS